MTMDRRSLLKGLAATGAGTAVGAAVRPVHAGEAAKAPADAVGLLYDATRCIGCKACVVACKQANDMPGSIYDEPKDLDGNTKNIIKKYEGEAQASYMKQQCMHCLDPACARACMIGAFKKRHFGIVTWDPDRCIGCRYCQIACPYNIPKFQWGSANPKIVKCELCDHIIADENRHLREGALPGCVEACPKEAVIFGQYTDLVADAKQRIAEHPERYWPAGKPEIFGLDDGAGTQCLYLASVDFDELGLPDLGEEPAGGLAQTVQHGIYQGFVAPVALYAILGAVLWRNRRSTKTEEDE